MTVVADFDDPEVPVTKQVLAPYAPITVQRVFRDPGTHRIIVTASNGHGGAAVAMVDLTVGKSDAYAPVFLPEPWSLDGVVGRTFTWEIAVDGRPIPQVTLVAGQLPTGVSLGFEVVPFASGITTEAGVFTFTLQATNEWGTATQEYTVRVLPAEVAAPPAATAGAKEPPRQSPTPTRSTRVKPTSVEMATPCTTGRPQPELVTGRRAVGFPTSSAMTTPPTTDSSHPRTFHGVPARPRNALLSRPPWTARSPV